MQRLEQDRLLLGRNASRRLVQNQRLHAQRQQAHDVELLPLCNRQVGDRRIGVEVEAEAAADVAQFGFSLLARHRQPKQEVLQHRERRHVERVLLEHADAMGDSRLRAAIVDDATVDDDLAAVGRLVASQNLHQCRLARAVLAEHANNLAARQQQVDVVIGVDRSKPLVYMPKLNVHRVSFVSSAGNRAKPTSKWATVWGRSRSPARRCGQHARRGG